MVAELFKKRTTRSSGRFFGEHASSIKTLLLAVTLFAGLGLGLTPQQALAQTEPTPEQRSCMANGTCTCRLVPIGGVEGGLTRLVCTQVNGAETTTTVVNPNTGGGVSSTENADGTITETPIAARDNSSSCSLGDFGACIRALPGMLFTGIAFLFLTLSGLILGLAGTVFNWVVIRTVFQFGTYFGTNEGMLIAWGVMRDIANIGLLFGFIFMGVLLILNVDGGGHGHGSGMSAKKAIPRLIIFAVLLNFSLFASQAVIDVANAFSSSFATLAGESCTTKTSTGTASDADQTNEECSNVGISGQILKAAGLTSIWDAENRDIDAAMKNLLDRPYSYAVSLMMLSVFVLVTAMVLLAGSIMLIIRVVILSLLMVTSPIGFAGMAIPKLQGLASMWWSKLMSQAFFAPVFLLLIFISIKLTEGLSSGEATLANALIANQGASVAGNMQVVMVFMVVIGFMIASLVAASKIGAVGAKFATQSVAGATVGFAGFAGRRTLGAASGNIAKRIASSNYARSDGFGSRFAYNLANKGATSSYSARTGINNLTKGAGLDIGNAGKNVSHGLHGIEEAEVKKRKEFAEKTLAQTPGEQAAEKRLKEEKERIKLYREAAKEELDRGNEPEETALKAQKEKHTEAAAARLKDVNTKKQAVAKLEADGVWGNELDAQKKELAALEEEHAQASEIEAADITSRQKRMSDRKVRFDQILKDYDNRSKEIDRTISGYESIDSSGGITWNKGLSKESAQREYGEALGRNHGLPLTLGHHINQEASAEIIKKLKRSKRDKLVDAIKENAKEDREDDGDHKKEEKSGSSSEKKSGGDTGHH